MVITGLLVMVTIIADGYHRSLNYWLMTVMILVVMMVMLIIITDNDNGYHRDP